jgi:hypothetical protein
MLYSGAGRPFRGLFDHPSRSHGCHLTKEPPRERA